MNANSLRSGINGCAKQLAFAKQWRPADLFTLHPSLAARVQIELSVQRLHTSRLASVTRLAAADLPSGTGPAGPMRNLQLPHENGRYAFEIK